MNKAPFLTVEALKAEFSQQEDFIINKHYIDFELHETGQIIATHALSSDPECGYWVDLIADYNNLEQFIEANQLRSLKDVEQVKPSALWVRYLKGDGYVCTDIDDIDAELCFRIVKSITMVYSADLSFYQEIPHVLSMTHQFERYVMENMPRFMVAAGMRPLLLPEEVWLP